MLPFQELFQEPTTDPLKKHVSEYVYSSTSVSKQTQPTTLNDIQTIQKQTMFEVALFLMQHRIVVERVMTPVINIQSTCDFNLKGHLNQRKPKSEGDLTIEKFIQLMEPLDSKKVEFHLLNMLYPSMQDKGASLSVYDLQHFANGYYPQISLQNVLDMVSKYSIFINQSYL